MTVLPNSDFLNYSAIPQTSFLPVLYLTKLFNHEDVDETALCTFVVRSTSFKFEVVPQFRPARKEKAVATLLALSGLTVSRRQLSP